MLHRVLFLHASDKYFPDDRAAFPLDIAQRFVDGGKAVFIDAPPNGGSDDDVPFDRHGTTPDELPPPLPPADSSDVELPFDIQGMKISEVRGLVAGLDSMEELRALRDSEVAHPDYPGGRRGALKALDGAIAKLG